MKGDEVAAQQLSQRENFATPDFDIPFPLPVTSRLHARCLHLPDAQPSWFRWLLDDLEKPLHEHTRDSPIDGCAKHS